MEAASATVTPGTDMVMCLSCHQPHATEFDGMLRFDYQQIIAGGGATGQGCLACHTTKGINKQS
jgi:predicted CXXCH cytochrome family protein